MDTIEKTTFTKGGAFIIEETDANSIFIPSELSEEQVMMRQAMVDFIDNEIEPRADLIDSQKDLSIVPTLLEKTGELGFLAVGVPEEFGGIEMDFLTSISNAEAAGGGYSFSLAVGVQTSIGIAPIVLYGNEAQKAKYLPKLVTAEWKTCYCLTEPSSGSDANSAKSKATLTEDGKHYILNGQKMWITNGGFANIFIVFAKIEDDSKISALIVEEEFGGVTRGVEEKKMGIKGSSTRQLFFNNVKVPVENLLGERNKGFKIAVNVLNTGRIKLAASSVGVSKKCIDFSVNYANERIQFGVPISSFGAIKHKLGQMTALTYAGEAAVYRTAHNIDLKYQALLAEGMDSTIAKAKCVEEYAIECAILKVFASEVKGYVVDEGVQIYGGMGFSAEAPVERLYRDARISRIFEGTNEINRMLTVDMLVRKALKGQLNILGAAKAVAGELMSFGSFDTPEGPLGTEKQLIQNLKKAFLLVGGAAVQKLQHQLKEEQEVLLNLADMLIQVYIAESILLRTEKQINQTGEAANDLIIEMTRITLYEAIEKVAYAGRQALYAFGEDGDELRMALLGLKRFTKAKPYNLKEARRKVANKVIAENRYCF